MTGRRHRPRQPARRARLRHRPRPPGSRPGRRGPRPVDAADDVETAARRCRSDPLTGPALERQALGGDRATGRFATWSCAAVQRDDTDRSFAVRHEISLRWRHAARSAAGSCRRWRRVAFRRRRARRSRPARPPARQAGASGSISRAGATTSTGLGTWRTSGAYLEARVRASRDRHPRRPRRADLPRSASGPETALQVEGTPVPNRCGAGWSTPGPTASSIASCWRNCAAKWRWISSTATSSARPSRPP